MGVNWVRERAGILPAVVAGAAAAILLCMQVAADPAVGITFSSSPFTDEGWSVLGARNMALLGVWATDEWQLYIAQLPFNIAALMSFTAFGVGIIQARIVAVACTVGTVGLLTWIVGRRCGPGPGLLAGIGYATASLVLYYGRLSILEPMVSLWLTAALVALVTGRDRWLRHGVAAGIFITLALATKPSAAAAVLGMAAGMVLAAGWRNDPPWRRLMVVGGVLMLGVAAWLVLVLSQPGLLESILRIWPNQLEPTTFDGYLKRITDYPSASDNAIPLTAPLIGGGIVGLVAVVAAWRRLDRPTRLLIAGSVGWFVAGAVALLIVPYRPNRYVVPLIPALAVMTGIGGWLVIRGIVATYRHRAERPLVWLPAALVGLAIVGVAYRGVGDLSSWSAVATYRLPEIQEEMLALIGDGRPMQGGPAATMGMRVAAPAVIVQGTTNSGDLYADRGVRWVFNNRTGVPNWAPLHREAWRARERLVCNAWPSGEACLYRVP